MKEYKVEALIYHSENTFDSERIVKKSKEGIQTTLDEYASQGYRLTSTSSINVAGSVHIYLYFEKDI